MIRTKKGIQQVKTITISGMKRAPIVICELPNHAGGVSYSVTHKPSGYALIAAKTDDLKLVTRCARKIWTQLDPKCRAVLEYEDFKAQDRELFNRVGHVVVAVRKYLDEQISKRIKKEVSAELKAQRA